jgi:hypothetical protein
MLNKLMLGMAGAALLLAQDCSATNPGSPAVAACSDQELIDRLQEETDEGIGSHSTAWVSGFLAIDEKPQFRGGILGSSKPKTSPIMRELVCHGVAALPALLDHMDDQRLTKLVINHNFGMGAMWHSDEYAPRFGDPKRQPPGVSIGLEQSDGIRQTRKAVDHYTLHVGDLCFIAVGQIVNRGLNVVRYQPSACIVINSPVQTPALAAAVRRDWAGLTAKAHEQSLAQDALSIYPYATASAMVRLLYYYPPAGEALALKLLNRPLYDENAVWDFIQKRLVKEPNPARWKALLDDFRTTQGPAAADAIPSRLHWIYWLTSSMRDKEFLEGKACASQLLAQFYPDYDLRTPTFINATTPREQRELVDSLARCRSEQVDQTVARMLQAASRMQAPTADERRELNELAEACLTRLVGGVPAEDLTAAQRAAVHTRVQQWRTDFAQSHPQRHDRPK